MNFSFLTLLLFILNILSLISCLNSDIGRTTVQLIENRGLPVESHMATTADGYELILHCIPSPGKPVVLLQHGLLDTSATFVINGRTESLGYILADNRYEVFIANSRGNKYSSSHTHLSSRDSKFWEFDFDQHAQFDIPASIDTALKISKQNSLILIGHSQGASAAFVALATVPGLQQKVSLFIALAPVTYLKYQKSTIFQGMAKLRVDKALAILGNREIIPAPDTLAKILGKTCNALPSVCAFTASTLFGKSTHIDRSREGVYANHWPDRTSVRNMRHWIQNARSGEFRSYDASIDYGKQIRNIKIPVAVYSGGKDCLGDPQDTAFLVKQLPNLVESIEYPEYSHMDFVWASDAAKIVYPNVLKLVEKYSNKAALTMQAFELDETEQYNTHSMPHSHTQNQHYPYESSEVVEVNIRVSV